MINWVVSSFQRLYASSLVAAFVLNLLLSIFFLLALLVFYYWCIFCLFSMQLFCVFCLVAAVVFFASVSLLVHCFVAFIVCLLCSWQVSGRFLCFFFCYVFITMIILYSILSFRSWSSATSTIFGNESLVWFLLISQRKTHQIVCIATWTGVLNDEACFLFFSFSFIFKHLIILPDDCVLNKHTYFSFAVLLFFRLVFTFVIVLFSSMPIFSSFVSLLFSFWGESYFYLASMQGLPLVYLFLKLFGGGIYEADVWVQHGSVRRVTGSETLNTSARLTLLTVPGWVGECARLANDYQAQLSPAGTKSWSDHCWSCGRTFDCKT